MKCKFELTVPDLQSIAQGVAGSNTSLLQKKPKKTDFVDPLEFIRLNLCRHETGDPIGLFSRNPAALILQKCPSDNIL